jgi:hypothetical protein
MLSQKRFLLPLFLLFVAVLTESGCGIGPIEDPHGPLAKIVVTGSRAVGQEMQIELDYQQTYNVAVDVQCDLEQGSKVVQVIGSDSVPANPSGRPDATPAAGTLSFPLMVEKAGSYTVVCFAAKDAGNRISVPLKVSG